MSQTSARVLGYVRFGEDENTCLPFLPLVSSLLGVHPFLLYPSLICNLFVNILIKQPDYCPAMCLEGDCPVCKVRLAGHGCWHTQEVSREASSGADELRAVHLPQLVSHVGMQLLIQRFYLEAEEEKETIYFFFFILLYSTHCCWTDSLEALSNKKLLAGICTPNVQLSFAPCLRAQALSPDSSHRKKSCSGMREGGREHC